MFNHRTIQHTGATSHVTGGHGSIAANLEVDCYLKSINVDKINNTGRQYKSSGVIGRHKTSVGTPAALSNKNLTQGNSRMAQA